MDARRLVVLVTFIGWTACLGSIALTLTMPVVSGLPAVQWSPWLLGLLVLGISHGAFDHRVGVELRTQYGDCPDASVGAGFYAAYLTAALTVLMVWFASPIAASACFLAVAATHFGQGDLYWSRRFGLSAWSGSVGYRASLLLARSALPIALPLWAWPSEFSDAADALANRLFGRASWSVPPQTIAAGLIALMAVVGLQVAWSAWLAWGMDGPTRRAAAVDIAETLLLVAMFAVVPPVLALGVYFNAWHSLRHIARLLLIAAPTRELVASGRLLAAFWEFQKRSLPMTCGALALASGLGFFVGRSRMSVADLGALVLVALSALTLPHVLVVTWMDARQGVWSTGPRRTL